MSKLGFMQDLIRGIKKIVRTDEPKPTTIRETVVHQAAQTNTAPLLRRAFMFLEDGNWQSADEYCEKVLDMEPENAEAYLGKLMAELHVRMPDGLKDQPESFDDCNNYKKAFRFGDEKLKTKLSEVIAFISDRNETARKDDIYRSARSQMTGSAISGYESAIKAFRMIPVWKDADNQIIACQRKIEEIRAKEEADRLERERKAEEARIAEEKRKKKNRITALVLALFVLLGVGAYFYWTKVIQPNQQYNDAVFLYEAGYYEEAIASFTALDEYKDSAVQIEKCETAIKDEKYAAAVDLYITGKYEDAIAMFTALDGYKDSADQIENCYIGKFGEEKYNLIKNIKAGDTYTFGAYEQDNKTTNGKEDIEWIVLEKDGFSILLVSKYALDRQQYNTSFTSVTWKTCSLRKWLNETFLNAAFSVEEQNRIISSTVAADSNPSVSTSPGNNTSDKVFLLSITEANKYFSSDETRKCAPTDYTIAHGASTSDSNKTSGRATCVWWLRTPGLRSDYAADVSRDGSVYDFGDHVNNNYVAVRPAMWIDLGAGN